MSNTCPDCGVPTPGAVDCRTQLDALLFLESEVPGAARGLPHFFAVACFNVQHQRTMRLTDEATRQIVENLKDALDGHATIEDILRRGREFARVHGPAPTPDTGQLYGPGTWSMLISDTLGATPDNYVDIVTRWARSVVDDVTRVVVLR